MSRRIPPTDEMPAAIAQPRSAGRGELRPAWHPRTSKPLARDLLKSMLPKEIACPRCHSKEVIKYGRRKGIQRYNCKRCTKYFTELTGTPFEGLHLREEFLEFSLCMIQGLSVRASAGKAGVSKNTAFNWRHRIISKLAEADAKVKLNGVVEISQRLIPISYKGSRKFGGTRVEGLPLPRSYWPIALSRSTYHTERGSCHSHGSDRQCTCRNDKSGSGRDIRQGHVQHGGEGSHSLCSKTARNMAFGQRLPRIHLLDREVAGKWTNERLER